MSGTARLKKYASLESTCSSGTDCAECLTLDFSPNREAVNKWKKLPDCDEFVGSKRSKHTMVSYKEAIYIFGGDNGKQMLSDLIRYDPSDNSWGRAFAMGQTPAPRYHHAAVVYASSMFIFGGYTGDIPSNSNLTNRNDLFEYRFSTGQWSELHCEGRLPPARSAHGAAVFEGCMYVFGGFDGHSRLADMWCVNLQGPVHKWEEVKQSGDCPPACCNFALSANASSMFLFSGESGAKSTNSLFEFKFATKCWRRISTEHLLRGTLAPPDRRYGHSMVQYDRHLYLFGGAAENIYSGDLNVFDLETYLWAIVTPVSGSRCPSGRLFHSAVVVQDGMYVFGGTVDNNVRSCELFRFQFPHFPRCTLHEDFGRLLESQLFCDLRFLVGKDSIPLRAHVAMVAARSPVLRQEILKAKAKAAASLNSETSPSSSSKRLGTDKVHLLDVVVEDTEPFALQMLLDFIYTDKIEPKMADKFSHEEESTNQIVVLIMEVYRLALRFSMKRLEALCVQYLESIIDLENVLSALQLASAMGLDHIREFCLRFITRESKYNQIIMSKEFETIEQSLMVEIIRRRQFPVPGICRAFGGRSPSAEGSSRDMELKSYLLQTQKADLSAFLLEGIGLEFCDLTLVCNEERFGVHRAILAARSGYFEAMFRSFMPETPTVSITLGEFVPSVQAFKSLLKYIYTGIVEMPPEDSLYLFSAPFYFSFSNNRLQAYCKENLETGIKWNNVLDILEAADRIGSSEMKRHCLKMVVNNFYSVISQQKVSELNKELLLDILKSVALTMEMSGTSKNSSGGLYFFESRLIELLRRLG